MNIATIMVTYNRLNDLKKAIETYENQSFLPKTMIIVNNCSTDGTKEFLDQWEKEGASFSKKIIHLQSNIGGSGGFHEGLKYASENTDCDWYWIADDDAFLDKCAFEKIYNFTLEHKELTENASALCSSVIESNEKISVGHRRSITSRFGFPRISIISADEYKKEYMEIEMFTFVGSLVKASTVSKVGLPYRDFFIYYDDLEYSYRVGKNGKMYCITNSKVYHDAAKHEAPYGTSWRSYYQSRNTMFFFKYHFPIKYWINVFKRFLQRVVLVPIGKYSVANQLDWDAMKDTLKNNMGISEKYYIGWKSE